MRMRKKKHLNERLALCEAVLEREAAARRGAWRETFGKSFEKAPLELEIGCGKGSFLCGMAQQYPARAFIGLERSPEALLLAAEKAVAANLKNVRFVIADAAMLDTFFAPEEVSTIYLNFSDPWPKSRHAKRRLTAPPFLALYRACLEEDGKICQKTDNPLLFDFSLDSFAACGWRVEDVCRDLHASPQNADNIMTEYERAFSAKGIPILRAVAYKK